MYCNEPFPRFSEIVIASQTRVSSNDKFLKSIYELQAILTSDWVNVVMGYHWSCQRLFISPVCCFLFYLEISEQQYERTKKRDKYIKCHALQN